MKRDDIKKLHQKKYRESFRHFLVEGEHLVLELAKASEHNTALLRSELWVTEQYADWQSPFKTTVISQKQMAQIADTKNPQGIIAVVPFWQHSPEPNNSLEPNNGPEQEYSPEPNNSPELNNARIERAVYLHEVQDPGNLGTILRTLAWFGGFRLLLSSNSVDPFNPKVVRASMGAIFHVPIEREVDLTSLPERYKKIACLDIQGERLSTPNFNACDCYLFGNEARGVPRDALEAMPVETFSIQGGGAIESLNLATAVNMSLYELNR